MSGAVPVRSSAVRCGQPVGAALEGVGGQVDVLRAGAVEQGRPVDVGAAYEEFGGRGQETLQTTVVTPQRAGDQRVDADAFGGLLDAHGQYRVRAGLDERGEAVLDELPYGVLEADRVAQVAIPVRGVQAVGELAGDRGIEGNLRAERGDRGQHVQEFRLDPLHVGGVRGVARRHLTGLDALLPGCLHDLDDRVRRRRRSRWPTGR